MDNLYHRCFRHAFAHAGADDAWCDSESMVVKRSNGYLALMFLDLDRFKDINDTLDHSIGDALLIELAKCLCLALPEEDTVTRLGGDEFILFAWGRCTRSRACGAKITEYYCRVLSD